MKTDRKGRIITFYSYKGGTGRTMALANVGWILASSGKRVLLVDWDLEAPGLHRYLSPFLLDGELTSSDGIIDLILDFSLKALERKDGESPPLVELADITRNVIAVNSKSMRAQPRVSTCRPPGTFLRGACKLFQLAGLLRTSRRRIVPGRNQKEHAPRV